VKVLKCSVEPRLYSHRAQDMCLVHDTIFVELLCVCVCVCVISVICFKVKEVFICCSVAPVVRDTHGIVLTF
jgi:hypothetical protein